MKKILSLTLMVMILIFGGCSLADGLSEKTVIVVLDEMDFKSSKEIINDKLSMGLLNIKTSGKNFESLFMTIGTGRKVDIADNEFKSIVRRNNRVVVDGYRNIKKDLDDSYPNFSKQISFLGDSLDKKNIKTSFIGEKEKSEVLLIADKKGEIDYWYEKPLYDKNELIEKSKDMLMVSDVLLISFDTKGDTERLDTLKSFLSKMDKYNLIVFPKTVSGDVSYRLNNSMVPILYKDGRETGILTSNSTKRDSVITSLDIFPTLASFYNLDVKSNIGNKIEVLNELNIINLNKNTLLEFLNLNLIKYIFHALVTLTSIYIAYVYVSKKKDFKKVKILLNAIILSILLSIILGAFHLHISIFIYTAFILGISFFLSVYCEKERIRILEITSILTNLLIITFIFLSPKILYNSFIGYNSIVAGGRFYGFNNEIMGVLIVTSVIVYYEFKKRVHSEYASNLFLITYFSVVIIALTGSFGANFGGFLTGIALFLIVLYLSLFNRRLNKKTILSLVGIGALILASNLYIDMKNDTGSHAGNLIERINILGFYEFVDMIIKKLKQLFLMTILPPWSLAFLTQGYFIVCKFREIKTVKRNIPIDFLVMFIASVIALFINDTGVVAFVYMNTYLISKIIEE